MTDLPRYMTTEQTADWLQMSKGSLDQDRHLGRGLPFVRIGRKVRYDREQVLKYMEDNTIHPAGAA